MIRTWLGPILLLGGVTFAYAACGDDDKKSGPELPYTQKCPGMAGCKTADGVLMVGAGKRTITPEITETFRDCGRDGLCPGDEGYEGPDSKESDGEFLGHPAVLGGKEPFDDANGNGYFDAVWIAGFGTARPAIGVHDDLWARAVVIRKGETTLALVAVDLVGYFYDEVTRIRDDVADELGIDHIMIASTHVHEGPDTIGIWGYDEGTTGVDPAYMEATRRNVADAIRDAVADLAPAKAIAAEGAFGVHPTDDTVTQTRGMQNIVSDYRDPVVMDTEMRVLQFVDTGDDSTIATIVNWSNHPESLCSHNNYISSDFVHWLRLAVEDGVDRDGVQVDGVGGMALYFNGPVGGMQSNVRDAVYDIDGTLLSDTCNTPKSVDDPFFNRPRAYGDLAAIDALRILRESGAEMVDPDLSWATKVFRAPVENYGYHAMFITGVFYGKCNTELPGGIVQPRRCLYGFDEDERVTDANLPEVETEVDVINFGEIQMLTVPAEMLPEWWVGGYDGAYTGTQPLIDPNNPNPPDLTKAPEGPYLKERQTRPRRWLIGLANDELGYIIPPYNFQLDETLAWIDEAPGDHYEETNSLGMSIGPFVDKLLTDLIAEVP